MKFEPTSSLHWARKQGATPSNSLDPLRALGLNHTCSGIRREFEEGHADIGTA